MIKTAGRTTGARSKALGELRTKERQRVKVHFGIGQREYRARFGDGAPASKRFADLCGAMRMARALDLLVESNEETVKFLRACERAYRKARIVVPDESIAELRKRLLDYLWGARSRLIDLRGDRDTRRSMKDAAGFLVTFKGRDEILIRGADFERVLGSKSAADILKDHLDKSNLIASTGAGAGKRTYSVKRAISKDEPRANVIALDFKMMPRPKR